MTDANTKTNARRHFSRKLLAIPYGLFLAAFVIVPLLIVVYYAFTNDDGEFTFEYVRVFFSGNGEGLKGFLTSYNFKTILRSFFISLMSTIVCLAIAYPSLISSRIASSKTNPRCYCSLSCRCGSISYSVSTR